jgi:hypothetical protein
MDDPSSIVQVPVWEQTGTKPKSGFGGNGWQA